MTSGKCVHDKARVDGECFSSNQGRSGILDEPLNDLVFVFVNVASKGL